MRYTLAQVGTILTLLLIAMPSIYSASSSLQQEFSIPSMGNILIQDIFAETIFFEYGAEPGIIGTQIGLQPPWDEVRGSGTGGYGGTLEIDDTHARTGTKSIYFYQEPPPKVDADRRVTLQYYGSSHQKHEGYWSWWMYVDGQMLLDNLDWGPNLGGYGIRFGPEDEKLYRWGMGVSWHVSISKRIYYSYGTNRLTDGIEFADDLPEGTWYLDDVEGYESYTLDDFENEWVHFQFYFKIANGTDGATKAWFSAPDSGIITPVLIADYGNIATDPRGYSEWTDDPIYGGNCDFLYKNPDAYPKLDIMLYQGVDSFENWMWVDDVVAATEKVLGTYGVYG